MPSSLWSLGLLQPLLVVRLELLGLDLLLGLLERLLHLLGLLRGLLELRLELGRVWLLPFLAFVSETLREELAGPLAQLASGRGVDQLEQADP